MPFDSEYYRIKKVSEITGVNAITLRSWESRYQLISPSRTEKGHRLYSKNDVDTIHNIVMWINKGVNVGQIKPLINNKTDDIKKTKSGSLWKKYTTDMLAAIEQFNIIEMENLYNRLLAIYPINLLIQNWIVKIFIALGQSWKNNPAGIAEEHFFTHYIRNKIGARFHHLSVNNSGKILVLACLPNEEHDLGLSLFSLYASEMGYRCIVLGAKMPLPQLAEVCHRVNADGLVLYGKLNDEFIFMINSLVNLISGQIYIASSTSKKIEAIDKIINCHITSLNFEDALHQIQASLHSKKQHRA